MPPSKYVNIEELDFEMTRKLRPYLKGLIDHGGSDLHVKANAVVRARINGDLVPVTKEKITHDESVTMAKEILRGRFKEFVENKEIDFLYMYDENTHFRGNVFLQMDGVSAVFRVIPAHIATIDQLELPSAIHRLTDLDRGLILVTGVTGSGKSTTLAAIIDEINRKKKKHIITIEDPIEFVHQDRKSLFSHRNIGTDTDSFAAALKYALREDPDVILIGEMRDKETVAAALTAAETGHLVFGTLHTNSASQTVNRIIDVFSGDEQPQIRAMISSSLVAVISQVLLPKIGGGRVAVPEILVTNHAIANLIREDKVHQIYSQMQVGQSRFSMETMNQSLATLYQSGKISLDDAFAKSNDLMELKQMLGQVI